VNGQIFFIFLFKNCSIQNMIKDCYPSFHLYEECRRPKTGRPRGGSVTKKLEKEPPSPTCPGEALRRVSIIDKIIS
jgi:hypothetical protein